MVAQTQKLKIMSHTLSLEDLESFESRTTLAGSFGKGDNKSLNVVNKITITGDIHSQFTVEHHRNVVFTSQRLIDAIMHYNSL